MSWKHWATKAAFECALIVVSVVIGLGVNNWREAAESRRRAQEVRALFAEEIRANRDQLASDAYAPYHRKIAAAWEKLASIPHPTPQDRDAAWSAAPTGIHPFHPRDAVWSTFVHGEAAERISPRELLSLAEIYRAQDDLRQLNESLHAELLVPSAQSETSDFIRSQAAVTRLNLNDITSQESRLLAMYDQALRPK
jgi:Tfp pilus assembly protein PilV